MVLQLNIYYSNTFIIMVSHMFMNSINNKLIRKYPRILPNLLYIKYSCILFEII